MTIESRLEKLEKAVPIENNGVCIIFQRTGETTEDASARHYMEKPDDKGKREIIVRWV